VTNAKEITQLTKILKQKSESKSPKNQNIRKNGNLVFLKKDVQERHQKV